MEVQLLKGKKGKWYWRIVHINGQVLLTSETYYSRWSAKRAARRFANVNNINLVEVN